jgi:hypothetical protein
LSDGETLRFPYGVQYFDLRRLRKISKWPVPILFAKILHISRFFYFKEMRGWLRALSIQSHVLYWNPGQPFAAPAIFYTRATLDDATLSDEAWSYRNGFR